MTTHDAARENARKKNGEFGTQLLDEVPTDLDEVDYDDEDGFECGHCGTYVEDSGRDSTGSRRCDDLDPDHRYHAPAEVEDETPPVLRHPMQVRDDDAFLDAMEAVETETRVRDLVKGDWVREFGSDEWGVVQNVGVRTLRTDTWSDSDTDGGDHVVAVVRKDQGDAILAEHGALSTRVVNAYAKRREAAISVADDWDKADSAERSSIGHHRLRKAARDVWRSGHAVGAAADASDNEYWANQDSEPEMRNLEQAYLEYANLMRFGHSDTHANALVKAMRNGVTALDERYSPRTAR